MTTWDMILRLVLSGILGALIGMERMGHYKEAGLRTHFVVAIASSLIMLVSKYGFLDILHASTIVLDPSRMAAQVVSGIGFLGAGTIIIHRQFVHGLTTAAGLWATSAIGLSIGAGLYWVGIGAAILVLIALELLDKGEKKFLSKNRVLSVQTQNINPVLETVMNSGIKVSHIEIRNEEFNNNLSDITLLFRINTKNNVLIDEILTKLAKIPSTKQVNLD